MKIYKLYYWKSNNGINVSSNFLEESCKNITWISEETEDTSEEL